MHDYAHKSPRARASWLACALIASVLAVPGQAQTPSSGINALTGETPREFAARTKWWREARFGMFIHWGLYAVPADSTQGLAEWYFNNHTEKDPATGQERHLQVSEYERFAGQFDPVKFDAHKWVQAAKDAGMKYIVITSKHHDGFDMFDAHNSGYTIAKATPFHRDPLKELAAECRRQGLKFCVYHSIMDWHHPDYTPRRAWDVRSTDNARFDRYVTYLKEQLRELVTNYHPGVLWFDGEWEDTWTHDRGKDLYRYVRSLDPAILINNRVDKGRSGMAGMSASGDFAGDFGTPEQEVPPQGFADGRLWETCMTLNDTWGYARNDHNWKSADALIRQICDIASKGGNYLLNVGPTDQGEFTPETLERLAAIGRWMKTNGRSIYGTSGSPFKKLPFDGRCTQKGSTVYMQVFHWPEDGLRLPGLKTPIRSARALETGEMISVQTAPDGNVTLSKPAHLDPVATVLELKLAALPVVEITTDWMRPKADGSFPLAVTSAEIQGETARLETSNGIANVGFWTQPKDTVAWTLEVPQAGEYTAAIEYSCASGNGGSTYRIEAQSSSGGVGWSGTVAETGDWGAYKTETLPGKVRLPAGHITLRIIPQTMPGGAVMNLRRIVLKPAA